MAPLPLKNPLVLMAKRLPPKGHVQCAMQKQSCRSNIYLPFQMEGITFLTIGISGLHFSGCLVVLCAFAVLACRAAPAVIGRRRAPLSASLRRTEIQSPRQHVSKSNESITYHVHDFTSFVHLPAPHFPSFPCRNIDVHLSPSRISPAVLGL